MNAPALGLSLLLLTAGVVLAIVGVSTIGIAVAVIGGVGLLASFVLGMSNDAAHGSNTHSETVVVEK